MTASGVGAIIGELYEHKFGGSVMPWYGVLRLRGWQVARAGLPENAGAPRAVAGKDLVEDVCPRAEGAGVWPGFSRRRSLLACPGLEVHPPNREEERRSREDLAREISGVTGRWAARETQTWMLQFPASLHPREAGGHLCRRLLSLGPYRAVLGLSRRPLAADMAARQLVARPLPEAGRQGAVLTVEPGREESYLASLTLGDLGILDPGARQSLERLGLSRVGQVQECSRQWLRHLLGPEGERVHAAVRGWQEETFSPAPPPCWEWSAPLGQGDWGFPGLPALLQAGAAELSAWLEARELACRELGLHLQEPGGAWFREERCWQKEVLLGARRLQGVLEDLGKKLEARFPEEPVQGRIRAGGLEPLVREQGSLLEQVGVGPHPGSARRRPGPDLARVARDLKERFPGLAVDLGREVPSRRRERLLFHWDPWRRGEAP